MPDVTHLGWTGMQSSLRQWINESAPGSWRPGVVDVPVDVCSSVSMPFDLSGNSDASTVISSVPETRHFFSNEDVMPGSSNSGG